MKNCEIRTSLNLQLVTIDSQPLEPWFLKLGICNNITVYNIFYKYISSKLLNICTLLNIIHTLTNIVPKVPSPKFFAQLERTQKVNGFWLGRQFRKIIRDTRILGSLHKRICKTLAFAR